MKLAVFEVVRIITIGLLFYTLLRQGRECKNRVGEVCGGGGGGWMVFEGIKSKYYGYFMITYRS